MGLRTGIIRGWIWYSKNEGKHLELLQQGHGTQKAENLSWNINPKHEGKQLGIPGPWVGTWLPRRRGRNSESRKRNGTQNYKNKGMELKTLRMKARTLAPLQKGYGTQTAKNKVMVNKTQEQGKQLGIPNAWGSTLESEGPGKGTQNPKKKEMELGILRRLWNLKS